MMDYSFYLEDLKPMTLDNETQRQFLLEMFKQVQFPGHLLDLAYEVKAAVQKAEAPVVIASENKAAPTLGGP
jgi:hypothetical protein